jgi:hypothetical protein
MSCHHGKEMLVIPLWFIAHLESVQHPVLNDTTELSDRLTAWHRVFLGKVIVQLFSKFPTFYGIKMFINMFEKSHHWVMT